MEYEQPHWIDLIFRPEIDAPPDMPPGEVSVEVPLHPRGRPAEVDERWQIGFPPSSYVKAAQPVTHEVPLGLTTLREWFQWVFAPPNYTVTPIAGRSQDPTEIVDWTILQVRPAQMPDVIIQVTLNGRDAGDTTVTYRAEQHPAPDRDRASYLPTTVQRVDVEYTIVNHPRELVRRTIVVTEPEDIRRLVDQLNSFPRDIRRVALGRMMNRWANLRFVTEEQRVVNVSVDPEHDIIRVGDFPTLQGTIWSLLTDIAPPD